MITKSEFLRRFNANVDVLKYSKFYFFKDMINIMYDMYVNSYKYAYGYTFEDSGIKLLCCCAYSFINSYFIDKFLNYFLYKNNEDGDIYDFFDFYKNVNEKDYNDFLEDIYYDYISDINEVSLFYDNYFPDDIIKEIAEFSGVSYDEICDKFYNDTGVSVDSISRHNIFVLISYLEENYANCFGDVWKKMIRKVYTVEDALYDYIRDNGNEKIKKILYEKILDNISSLTYGELFDKFDLFTKIYDIFGDDDKIEHVDLGDGIFYIFYFYL